MLDSIREPGSKVTVRSGHGVGKDGIASGIILWHIETRDFSRCACTAPSGHQLRDILWGELAKWRRRSQDLSQARGEHPRFWLTNMFELTQDRLYDIGAPREWYAVARTARKENPEALQGLHASDIDIDDEGILVTRSGDTELLFILDEASGIPDEIYEVAEGALSSPNSRVLLIGNATRNTGFFAASHKERRGGYKALHFKSQDSPLVDKDYRANLVRKYGETSNVVRVRADGEFPLQDDEALISLEYTEAALSRDPRFIEATGPRMLGIDVARMGNDRTAFVCRQGRVVDHIAISAKKETMETVGMAVQFAQKWRIDAIYVDVIGLGAGVYDRLAELKKQGAVQGEVYGVNVANLVPSWAKQDDDARARTIRDYLWIQMWQWLRDEAPVFAADKQYCEELAGELTSPKMKLDSSGRIVIESKDDMKRRGIQSPDLSDACGVTFAPVQGPVRIGRIRS